MRMVQSLNLSEQASTSLSAAMKTLKVAATAMSAGVYEASKLETYSATLLGITDSLQMTAYQMELIDKIASKGVFGQQETFEAIRTLDKFNVSIKDNIDLVEKLGARSGNLQSAAQLIGMVAGGRYEGLTKRLTEFGIGPYKLRAAGLVVDGMDIKATPAQVMDALRRIEQADQAGKRLESTFASTLRGMTYSFGQLLATVGEPLLKPLTAAMDKVREGLLWMRDLNAATGGWAGIFAQGGLLIIGLSKIVGFLKEIYMLEIVIGGAAKARAMWQAGAAFIDGLRETMFILRSIGIIELILLAIEGTRAWVAVAWATAMANPGAVVAAGILIAAGIGGIAAGIAMVNNYRRGKEDMKSGETAANRPVRRDDIERIHKKMYANAWGG